MIILILQVIVGVFFMFTGVRIISGKMANEFKRLGTPPVFNFLTGLIEIVCSIGMIVGIWVSMVATLTGILLGGTMLVAAGMLLFVAKDPFSKAIPAIILCLLSAVIAISHLFGAAAL
ncbi:DoxX family protein [Paenibacillus qinlingensis]|uniref:Membrane protein YphA (DoxX/SURF4 family) n=1 Tax=Paenibacillus qinlingensis TaxID=1837343 RepID=A0ABU1NXZ8_9BACL|nr:DoxX family protein [Paenibacillus qinlingensis]MDR6551946.1 putative membrane protein YphA (DoxX/SURF4 family) [Paenibacillus qinlingensis]